jgi:hypothetical protein
VKGLDVWLLPAHALQLPHQLGLLGCSLVADDPYRAGFELPVMLVNTIGQLFVPLVSSARVVLQLGGSWRSSALLCGSRWRAQGSINGCNSSWTQQLISWSAALQQKLPSLLTVRLAWLLLLPSLLPLHTAGF